MSPKFQIFKGSDLQYYYRLRATGNHEIILSGEGYTTKAACLNGIASVKINAAFDSRYTRLPGASGSYRFVLKAANGEIIGRSENYTSEAARENGISAVKRDAPVADTEDKS